MASTTRATKNGGQMALLRRSRVMPVTPQTASEAQGMVITRPMVGEVCLAL